MATLVDSGGLGPIRGPDRQKPVTKVDDLAEEIINGMFCTYEPPARKIKTTRTKGILRPSKSFQRERSTDTVRSVRWIDDSDEDFEKAQEKRANEKEEMKRNSLRDSCNSFAQTLLETSVEAGCMSPTGTGLHKTVSADSSVSLHRESKAHRYAVFDENGNPVSSKPGEEEPPKPPPTPPPSKNEVFIPQLCGVELNCVDEDLYETARPIDLSNKHSVSQESEDDNSLLESGMTRSGSEAELAMNVNEPKLAKEPIATSPDKKKKNEKTDISKDSTWQELRDRLDTENDWDGPDWMEAGDKSGSEDGLNVHGRYMAAPDAVVRNRSDVSSSHDAEEANDWDQSIPVLPKKNQKASRLRKKKSKDLETVQESESGVESGDEEKKRKGLFSRFKSKGNDPPPGNSNDEDDMAKLEKQCDVTNNEEKTSESAAGDQDEMSTRRSLKDKFRRRHNRSKSPSRRFLGPKRDKTEEKIPQPASAGVSDPDKSSEELDDRHDAPMPHLHPAHPLNQIRLQLQIHGNPNQVVTETIDHQPSDDRMSFITAHRNHFAGDQEGQLRASRDDDRMSYITANRLEMSDKSSQVGLSDYDRMSYITAHRKHTNGPNSYTGSAAGASDYHDRMSHIMEHRAHLGDFDRSSNANSEYDEKMSYIMASRQPLREESIIGSSANDYADRQSNIGAYREAMDSPKYEHERSSPRTMMQRQAETHPPPLPEKELADSDESWEMKTKLAWERIRNGFETSSSKSKEEDEGSQEREQTGKAEESDTGKKASEDASSIFSFLPAFMTQANEKDTAKDEKSEESPETSSTDEKDAGRDVKSEDSLENSDADANLGENDDQADGQNQKVEEKAQESEVSEGEANEVPEESQNKAEDKHSPARLTPRQASTHPKSILKSPLIEKKVTFGENSERTISPKVEVNEEEDGENAPPTTPTFENEEKEPQSESTAVRVQAPEKQQPQPLQSSKAHTNSTPEQKQEKSTNTKDSKSPVSKKEEKKKTRIAEDKKKTKKGSGRKFFKGVFGKGKTKPKESVAKSSSRENGKSQPSSKGDAAPPQNIATGGKRRGRPQPPTDDVGFLALSPVHGGSFFMDSHPNQEMYQRQMQWQLQNQMQYGYPMSMVPPHLMASQQQGVPPKQASEQTDKKADDKQEQENGTLSSLWNWATTEQVEKKEENKKDGHVTKGEIQKQDQQNNVYLQPILGPDPFIGHPQQSPKHFMSIHDRLMQQPPPPSIHDRLIQQQHHPSIHDRLMQPPHYPSIYDQMLMHQNGYFYSHQPHYSAVAPAVKPASPAGPSSHIIQKELQSKEHSDGKATSKVTPPATE